MMRRSQLNMALILLVLLLSCSVFHISPVDTHPTVTEVIIGFAADLDVELIKQHGGEVRHVYTIITAVLATLPEAAVETLSRNPKIAYIHENGRVKALGQVIPWGVERIKAPEAWSKSNGTGIRIAVLDTGISLHEDLMVYGGYDYVNNDDDPSDDNGHGTHVAGIAAALHNTVGVVGVSPEAYLYAVKMLDSDGNGTVDWAVKGIEWAVDNNMHIISMSWGSSANYHALRRAVNNAYRKGLLLVAAAGNSGEPNGEGDNVEYPARYDSVIAVAATDRYDKRASWSSTGPAVELAAPGVSIYSTWKDNSYKTISGTSMACPHVSGTAALVWQMNTSLTNSEVRGILQDTATDLGVEGRDNLYGYGLVNASAAVLASYSVPITVDMVSPSNGATVNDIVTVQASVENTTAAISTVEYALNNDAFTQMAFNASSGYWEAEWDTNNEVDASHNVTVRAEDINGNSDQKTVTVTVANIVEFLIYGAVQDGQGNVVSDVFIVAQDSSTGVEVASDTSNVTGEYALTVPKGTYNLIVTPPPESEFANVTLTNIEVSSDVAVDIILYVILNVTFGGGAPFVFILLY